MNIKHVYPSKKATCNIFVKRLLTKYVTCCKNVVVLYYNDIPVYVPVSVGVNVSQRGNKSSCGSV